MPPVPRRPRAPRVPTAAPPPPPARSRWLARWFGRARPEPRAAAQPNLQPNAQPNPQPVPACRPHATVRDDLPFTPETCPGLPPEMCAFLNTPAGQCDPDILRVVLESLARHIADCMPPELGLTDAGAVFSTFRSRFGALLGEAGPDAPPGTEQPAAPVTAVDAGPDLPPLQPAPLSEAQESYARRTTPRPPSGRPHRAPPPSRQRCPAPSVLRTAAAGHSAAAARGPSAPCANFSRANARNSDMACVARGSPCRRAACSTPPVPIHPDQPRA